MSVKTQYRVQQKKLLLIYGKTYNKTIIFCKNIMAVLCSSPWKSSINAYINGHNFNGTLNFGDQNGIYPT